MLFQVTEIMNAKRLLEKLVREAIKNVTIVSVSHLTLQGHNEYNYNYLALDVSNLSKRCEGWPHLVIAFLLTDIELLLAKSSLTGGMSGVFSCFVYNAGRCSRREERGYSCVCDLLYSSLMRVWTQT